MYSDLQILYSQCDQSISTKKKVKKNQKNIKVRIRKENEPNSI